MSTIAYQGPDRRRPTPLTRGALPGRRAVLVVGVAAAVTVLCGQLLASTGTAGGLRSVADAFAVLATAMFFGSGVLRYARWRVTGEALMAASSAALLVFALATFPVAMAARAFGEPGAATVMSSLARFAAALVVMVILAPALRATDVDSGRRPHRVAAFGLTAAVGSFAALAGVVELSDAELLHSSAASSALELLAAGLWLALATVCARAAWTRRSVSVVWTAAVLTMLAVASVMRSVSRTDGPSWQVAASVLIAVAACVALVNAAADVRVALAGEAHALVSTSGALLHAERLLVDVEARREDLVHDARSMIGTLRAASTTLDRHADELDADTRRRLRAAMDLELERLGHLLEGSPGQPPRSFDVAAVVGAVVTTLRHDDLDPGDAGGHHWAFGRPDALADVVHNLVVNARRHAPGSRITVRCETVGGTVRVHVEDRGPGVRADLADRIFERGVTSDPAQGQGLGLHVGRRLMREQGGDLEVRRRPGGGAGFVASLPAAAPGRGGVLASSSPLDALVMVAPVTRPSTGPMPGYAG